MIARAQEYGWCHLSAGDLLRAERATGSPDADLINTCEHCDPHRHSDMPSTMWRFHRAPQQLGGRCRAAASSAPAISAPVRPSKALYRVALTTALLRAYTDIKEGKIVPVEITVKLILAAMQKSTTKKFLIDGFPRSMNNYEVRRRRATERLRQEEEQQQPGRC